MTRTKALVFLIIFVFAGAIYADVRVSQLSSGLAGTQHRLAYTQHQILVSQKASTETRVKTVAQRCVLTRLVLSVLVRHHLIADATPFERSLVGCLVQLASVKRINAHTPSPSP